MGAERRRGNLGGAEEIIGIEVSFKVQTKSTCKSFFLKVTSSNDMILYGGL